jgi:hypothetical protein
MGATLRSKAFTDFTDDADCTDLNRQEETS